MNPARNGAGRSSPNGIVENGRRFFGWLGNVPLPVWSFLIVQFIAVTIWAIRLEGRVTANEAHLQTISRDGSLKTNANEQRLNAMVERVIVIERRQDEAARWVNRLVAMEQRIDGIAERTDRIVKALDSMYSTQQEILRKLEHR